MEELMKNPMDIILKILKDNPNATLEEMNKIAQKTTRTYNDTGIEEFDGLSPNQMHTLLENNWGGNLITINPHRYDATDIPIIQQINYFLNILRVQGELKLTAIGNLPPAIVKDIYSQRFITDRMMELGITKLARETDVIHIEFMNIICNIAGLVKKRNNKYSLTKAGLKQMNTPELVYTIIDTAFHKYNWAYFDRHEGKEIGQYGSSFTLCMLKKYGREWRSDEYYADLYFKAMPLLLEHLILLSQRVPMLSEHLTEC
jgi:hypothetical protein